MVCALMGLATSVFLYFIFIFSYLPEGFKEREYQEAPGEERSGLRLNLHELAGGWRMVDSPQHPTRNECIYFVPSTSVFNEVCNREMIYV